MCRSWKQRYKGVELLNIYTVITTSDICVKKISYYTVFYFVIEWIFLVKELIASLYEWNVILCALFVTEWIFLVKELTVIVVRVKFNLWLFQLVNLPCKRVFSHKKNNRQRVKVMLILTCNSVFFFIWLICEMKC